MFLFGDKLDKDTLDMNDNFIMYGNKKTNQKFGDITFYLKSLKAVTTSQMSALYAVIDYLTLHSSNGTLPETEYDNFVNMSPYASDIRMLEADIVEARQGGVVHFKL